MWTAVLRHCLVWLALVLAGVAVGCAPGAVGGGDQPQQGDDGSGAPLPDDSDSPSLDDGPDADPPPDDPMPDPAVWRHAFDASLSGALSAVWGNSPDDVFVVGGTPEQGEIFHYDGDVWRAMRVPPVPLLVWVFGFGPDDVYAVGVGGGVVHFDGSTWNALSSGTDEDLWGVWGPAPDDIWIVGGNVGQGEPVLLHYNGSEFTALAAPNNDRNASSLFKVWGIGSKVFAVGERGLIIQYENDDWFQVPAGADADEDFVSLWGTSENHIVAVGGRSGARIAVYDGENWTTSKLAGIPGLNSVCMDDPNEAIVGGVEGYVGSFNPFTNILTDESSDTNLTVHGAWADGSGRCYAVGGQFSTPYVGVALVRTFGDPGFVTEFPLDAPPECAVDDDCEPGRECAEGECETPAGCDGDDGDADGWADACDNCMEIPNAGQEDSDGDGVGDACDICEGANDLEDGDGDGVPDGCDRCLEGNDFVDADGDGVPNACDRCPADNPNDSDGDGVCDSADICPGHDDNVDTDLDGVPNGCDDCVGSNDGEDGDGDGVPDGCDPCPNDNPDDSDGDGVCNSADICPGHDDNVDNDGNGIPDGCCETEPHCLLGQACAAGICEAVSEDIELGLGNPFVKIPGGGEMPVRRGFQGFTELRLSYRSLGFTPGGGATVTVGIVMADDGTIVLVANPRLKLFTDIGGGINESFDFLVSGADPTPLFGRQADVSLTITDDANPAISVTIQQTVVIVDVNGP